MGLTRAAPWPTLPARASNPLPSKERHCCSGHATPCARRRPPGGELRVDGGACGKQPAHAIPGRPAGHSVVRPRWWKPPRWVPPIWRAWPPGCMPTPQAIASLWQADQTFYPTLSADRAQETHGAVGTRRPPSLRPLTALRHLQPGATGANACRPRAIRSLTDHDKPASQSRVTQLRPRQASNPNSPCDIVPNRHEHLTPFNKSHQSGVTQGVIHVLPSVFAALVHHRSGFGGLLPLRLSPDPSF